MVKSQFINDFISRYSYPEDAVKELDRLFDKSENDKAFESEMLSCVTEFFSDTKKGLSPIESKLKDIAQRYSENHYTLCLFFLILAQPEVKRIYEQNKLEDKIYYDSMDDIRCKLLECIECKGVPGIFVLTWYKGLLTADTLSFGRFEFEVSDYGFSKYHRFECGKLVRKGDITINFHIPSSGVSISDEVRLESYRLAYEHYKHLFPDGLAVFECSSWLLFPGQKKFLPENSNILRFVDDFTIIKSEKRDKFYDAWRVFGKYADLPAKKLPRDTSLRKSYAEWMSKGRRTGSGKGIFLFDGKRIIK